MTQDPGRSYPKKKEKKKKKRNNRSYLFVGDSPTKAILSGQQSPPHELVLCYPLLSTRMRNLIKSFIVFDHFLGADRNTSSNELKMTIMSIS